MGKKKRGAPEMACRKCGRGYHPRRKECPHCGAAKPGTPKRRASKSMAPAKKRGASKPVDSLEIAIKFVEQTGGLKAAKAALEEIERIKQL